MKTDPVAEQLLLQLGLGPRGSLGLGLDEAGHDRLQRRLGSRAGRLAVRHGRPSREGSPGPRPGRPARPTSATAATGDMVRPAAAAIDTNAPTATGSSPTDSAATPKNPNRLCVAAMPEPHTSANSPGNTAADGHSSPGPCPMASPSSRSKPSCLTPSPNVVAATMIRITLT